MKPIPENELDTMRGKMLVGHATPNELQDFLTYVSAIEALLIECDHQDFFGTEGYRKRLGWD